MELVQYPGSSQALSVGRLPPAVRGIDEQFWKGRSIANIRSRFWHSIQQPIRAAGLVVWFSLRVQSWAFLREVPGSIPGWPHSLFSVFNLHTFPSHFWYVIHRPDFRIILAGYWYTICSDIHLLFSKFRTARNLCPSIHALTLFVGALMGIKEDRPTRRWMICIFLTPSPVPFLHFRGRNVHFGSWHHNMERIFNKSFHCRISQFSSLQERPNFDLAALCGKQLPFCLSLWA